MNSSVNDIKTRWAPRPEDEPLVEAAMRLLPQVGRSLYSALERHSLSHDLPLSQVKALLHVALFRSYRPCTVSDIAQGVGISMPAASELIDRLVEVGLLERSVDVTDRRRVLLQLTPRARAFTEEMKALRRSQVRDALSRLDPAERPIFVRSLQALVDALGGSDGKPAGCRIEAPVMGAAPDASQTVRRHAAVDDEDGERGAGTPPATDHENRGME